MIRDNKLRFFPAHRLLRLSGIGSLAWLVLLCSGALALAQAPAPSKSESADTLALSVAQAVELSLQHNEDVKIAEASLDKARGTKREAYAGALPNLSAQAGYTRNVLRPVIFFPNPDTDEITKIEIGEKNAYQVALGFTQPLYAFGRIGGAIKVADYFLRSSQEDVSDARRQVILETKEAYYVVLLSEQALGISRESLEQAQRHFDETMYKLRQQMAARFDSMRAAVAVKNAQPLVIQTENALTLARLNLKRITGIPSSTPIKLTDRLVFAPGSYDLDRSIEKALSSRPDIAALRLRAAMSEKVVNVMKRNNFPFLSLVGSYILQGEDSNRLFPPSNKFAQSVGVGLSLSFPIFDGFANRGKVQQARADLGIVRYSLQKMEKAVRIQITQLYNELMADIKNLSSQEATVEMAEEAYHLALVRYRNGVSTSLELSDSEFALTNSRLNYLDAVYRCIITSERLENAMGD